MYKLMLRINGTYKFYQIYSDVIENGQVVKYLDKNGNLVTKQELRDYSTDDLSELSDEYLKLIKDYPSSDIIPIKAMIVTNSATIAESTPPDDDTDNDDQTDGTPAE